MKNALLLSAGRYVLFVLLFFFIALFIMETFSFLELFQSKVILVPSFK